MTRIKTIFTSALARLGTVPLSVHQLLFRLAIAGVFLRAGRDKIASWDSTVALFREEYRVPVLAPEVAAVTASSVEVGCSILLLVGLATRVATLPMLGMIATIQLFVYPQAWPEHLTWTSMLVFLLTRGGGTLALDHVIGTSTTARPRPTERCTTASCSAPSLEGRRGPMYIDTEGATHE